MSENSISAIDRKPDASDQRNGPDLDETPEGAQWPTESIYEDSSTSAFSITLYDSGDSGASFRLRNGPGETQRKNLVDQGSDLILQGDLIAVIHGTYTPQGPPATLIITEFKFLCLDTSQVFRHGMITFKFGGTNSCPEVMAISPLGHFSMDRTSHTEEVKHNANMNGQAGNVGMGLGVGGGVGWELVKGVEKKDSATLVGAIRVEGRFKGRSIKNTARWALGENKAQGDGIPHYLRTAILVKREDDAQFFGELAVSADVNVKYAFKSFLRKFLGKMEIDPVCFDPGRGPMGTIPDGLDMDNLAGLDLGRLSSIISTTVISTVVQG